MGYPTTGAIWRFVRALLAFVGGAAIAFALAHVQELVPDLAVAGVIGALLLALDKFLREKGWISYP